MATGNTNNVTNSVNKSPGKLRSDLDVLKTDASKIMSDISVLSKDLGSVGQEKAEQAARVSAEFLERELVTLRERLTNLVDVSRRQMETIEEYVRARPLMTVAGVAIAGLVIGRLLSARRDS